ncbi:acylphosphatase [Arthrobacter roseus]|uniref:acylphosphatase n=1 Tax=Arthrobacter roseus TaxID=136274 RepID=UPI001963141D|nr:acylphosphatase [Arthrobacter roseus]MBM7849444.1 acylphosphatase [Arthrobacter roseus]
MANDTASQRLHATVTGSVQGVGFRYWVRRQADQLDLMGTATNCDDGSVTVIAEGPTSSLDSLRDVLESGSTPGHVDGVDVRFAAATGKFSDFHEA